MQWTITSAEYHAHWCTAAQRSRLEGYGFQFGPVNLQGQSTLVGPRTVHPSGWGPIAVVVEVTTLEEMHALLDALEVVCIAMGTEGCDDPHYFIMMPVCAAAAPGRPQMLEELGA